MYLNDSFYILKIKIILYFLCSCLALNDTECKNVFDSFIFITNIRYKEQQFTFIIAIMINILGYYRCLSDLQQYIILGIPPPYT